MLNGVHDAIEYATSMRHGRTRTLVRGKVLPDGCRTGVCARKQSVLAHRGTPHRARRGPSPGWCQRRLSPSCTGRGPRQLGKLEVALRYFTVYGPRQQPDMAFTPMLSALLRGDVFTVHGSGQQTRDFTFAADVVAATIAAMDAPSPANVYNVCGGSETSLRDVIHISEELVGRRLKVENDARAVGNLPEGGLEGRAR